MKIRKPRTPEAAITRIMGELTDEGAGEAVGKSASAIRKWGDPDSDAHPNIYQCIALDKAYLEAGGEVAPILEVYTRTIAAVGLGEKASDVMMAALSLHKAVGEVSAAIEAAKSPTGPGGERIEAKERSKIVETVDIARRRLDAIEASLQPNIKEVG